MGLFVSYGNMCMFKLHPVYTLYDIKCIYIMHFCILWNVFVCYGIMVILYTVIYMFFYVYLYTMCFVLYRSTNVMFFIVWNHMYLYITHLCEITCIVMYIRRSVELCVSVTDTLVLYGIMCISVCIIWNNVYFVIRGNLHLCKSCGFIVPNLVYLNIMRFVLWN